MAPTVGDGSDPLDAELLCGEDTELLCGDAPWDAKLRSFDAPAYPPTA